MGSIRMLHRIASAGAQFQKGIYHLFQLKYAGPADSFVTTIRTYQAVYNLIIAMMLCDFDGVNLDPEELKQKLQKERAEYDPGAAITHGWVEKWSGFKNDHPLHAVANNVHQLFTAVVNARHNVIYRPYMLLMDKQPNTVPDQQLRIPGFRWEDCEVEDLVAKIPERVDIEPYYRSYYKIMKTWRPGKARWIAGYFITSLQVPLTTPPLTLLLNYARLLDPSSTLNRQLLKDLAAYREELLGLKIREPFLDDDH